MLSSKEKIDPSPEVSDEVKCTTCYMCACRCGIQVHLKGGAIRYIEGNPDHPVNRGVLCAKGSAGIMQQNSPAKLTKPLKRVGPRGQCEFEEIEWDEALAIATGWLKDIRDTDPSKLAFFTGRDQSQALTGFWASQFGTPNYAAHGGFCSVNMATAGLYSIGGSFWEFGEPDWDRTKYFMMFGVAEDHHSNPIKIGLGKLKARDDTKYVAINPVRTGYSAIADEWIGIRPGTDGLFVMALIHELLRAQKVDLEYLVRYTNAPWLVRNDPSHAEHGLFVRDESGAPLAFDKRAGELASALEPSIAPALHGRYAMADGSEAVPAFQLLAERYLDAQYSPEAVAARCGVGAATIKRIAAELARAAFEEEITLDIPWTDWAGRRHERMIGRPVAMHAMRGISAHSNGFHTCWAIHILQMLLGSIDCPGGFRYKPPFPKPIPPGPKPAGKRGEVQANRPLPGMPLGFVHGPEDLLVEEDGSPRRIDKAYSWEHPLASHGLMQLVILDACQQDPYAIDTLFMYMANMAWNSAMSPAETMRMLTEKGADGEYRIPHIIYSDAYFSETVAYADLVLPDTTYLERYDCISLLDRPISSAEGPADAIRQPVVEPDRDVRPFQDVLLELGHRLKLPAFTGDDGSPAYPGGYADYMVNHERRPGIGPLAGWRGAEGTEHGRGRPNPRQIQAYIDHGCFWHETFPPAMQYYKYANRDYLAYAAEMEWIPSTPQIVLQLYCEPMQRFKNAAQGRGAIQAPAAHRARIERYFDPLPIWYAPLEEAALEETEFPLHAITQRPMAMYHSWGSQNAWLRQIHGFNKLFVHENTARALQLQDDDWVWVHSHHAKIKAQIQTMTGCNENTVWTWNAIGKRKGAWNLDEGAEEASRGFLLNHLISELLPRGSAAGGQGGHVYANSDPVTGQAAWFDLRVKLTKAEAGEQPIAQPQFAALQRPPGMKEPPSVSRYGQEFLPPGNFRRRSGK